MEVKQVRTSHEIEKKHIIIRLSKNIAAFGHKFLLNTHNNKIKHKKATYNHHFLSLQPSIRTLE